MFTSFSNNCELHDILISVKQYLFCETFLKVFIFNCCLFYMNSDSIGHLFTTVLHHFQVVVPFVMIFEFKLSAPSANPIPHNQTQLTANESD